MDDFIKDMLKVSATEHRQRQSDSSTSFLQVLDRMFLKVYTEPDIMEATAGRQLMMREAPINNTQP